ncbi:hypothetical protein [Halosolutus gelatinilyticus]|uniref:hypothetical protein n=1 Tax=Halosolutus gelatinilyticus TaxID=2931975 RepID=UPI001FF62D9E|nr:hypothetical protein [Halosolutus gelatinilyticus]
MKRRAVIATISSLAFLSGCSSMLGDDDHVELHGSGDIAVVVDDDSVDLSADRFQAEHAENHSMAFHLHEGDEHWYMEGEKPVTFAEGLDLLPHFEYEESNGDRALTIDGETYDSADSGTDVAFYVNDEAVDPAEYELQDGDDLRVEISTEE